MTERYHRPNLTTSRTHETLAILAISLLAIMALAARFGWLA